MNYKWHVAERNSNGLGVKAKRGCGKELVGPVEWRCEVYVCLERQRLKGWRNPWFVPRGRIFREWSWGRRRGICKQASTELYMTLVRSWWRTGRRKKIIHLISSLVWPLEVLGRKWLQVLVANTKEWRWVRREDCKSLWERTKLVHTTDSTVSDSLRVD